MRHRHLTERGRTEMCMVLCGICTDGTLVKRGELQQLVKCIFPQCAIDSLCDSQRGTCIQTAEP